jgi:hypothetical protein
LRRLVIESDVVDATILSIDLLKTPASRVGGEARIVLLACEAFLLCGRHDLAVDQQRALS